MILGTIAAFCIVILFIGLIAGALVFGVAGIGTLLVIGFEIGCYLMPFVLLYLIAKAVWKATTDKKTEE